MKATIKLSLVLFSSVLASCASQPPLIDAELLAHEGVESSLALEKVDLPLKKIPRESLYDLLVGDVALSRNQFDTALAKYSHQARVTSDQEVIKLALRIAEHLEDQPTRMEMARLWLELVPNSAEARRAALDTFMASGHILDALDQGSWLYQNRDDLDAFIFVSTAPVASLQLFTAIIDHLATLSLSDEKKPIIQFIEAIFYQKSNQVIEAETKVREFLALRGKDQRGLLLLAQLLHQQQKKDEAIAVLEEALEDGSLSS